MNTIMVLAGYAFVVLAISFFTRRHVSVDEYLMGGRSASSILVGSALFTLVGGGELIALTSLAFVSGISALALFLGYSLGFSFLAAVAPRIRSMGDTARFLSLPDYIHQRFGKLAGHLVFLVSFGAFFAMLIIQFTAGGQLLQPLLKISYAQSVIVTAVIATTYLAIGGFKTVLATDLLQGASRMLMLPLIIYAVAGGTSTPVAPSVSVEPLSLTLWASLTITGFFAAAASSDVWQRIYAAKSDRAARTGFIVGAVSVLLFGYLLVQLGLIAKAADITKDPDMAFVAAMSVTLPIWAQYLAAILVLSTIMGTADTELFLLAGMLGREASRVQGKHELAEIMGSQSLTKSRVYLLAVCVSAVILSLVFRELVAIYTWLLSAVLVIAPTVILSLYFRAKQALVVIGMLLNTATFAGLAYFGILLPENAYLIVIPGFLLYGVSWVFSGSHQVADGTKLPL